MCEAYRGAKSMETDIILTIRAPRRPESLFAASWSMGLFTFVVFAEYVCTTLPPLSKWGTGYVVSPKEGWNW